MQRRRAGRLPPGLDSLYEQMVKQISAGDDPELCKEILATTSLTKRPLTLMELRTLLELQDEIGLEDLREIVSSCGSFLTTRDDTVYFVHQSASDYILGKAASQIFTTGIPDHHGILFSRSIDALSQTLRRNIHDLKSPGSLKLKAPDPDPLGPVEYSCIYWIDHLKVSEPGRIRDQSLVDGGIIHEFFKKYFLYWLEALSLLGNVSKGTSALSSLQALIASLVRKTLRLTKVLLIA